MPATLIPADRIRDVLARATNYEELRVELTALLTTAHEKIRGYNSAFEALMNEALAGSEGTGWSEKLDSFARLVRGWDGYKAETPSSDVVSAAKRFLSVTDLPPTRVAPSVVGGVGITFKRDGRKAYLELTNAGPVSLLLSDGVGDPHTEPVVLGDPALPAKIREFLGE